MGTRAPKGGRINLPKLELPVQPEGICPRLIPTDAIRPVERVDVQAIKSIGQIVSVFAERATIKDNLRLAPLRVNEDLAP